jgi:hypothetical protein
MENIDDEELERLQVDLNLRLDNPDGETEEERDESRKRKIEEISDLISEVKCRKRMKAHATALASTAGGGRAATTIVTEAANKIFCKDLSAASISRWADQLVDHQVRLQRSHTFDQIKLMLSETDRLEISQTLKSLKDLTLQQANNKNSKFILLIINETISHHNNVPHDPVTNNF